MTTTASGEKEEVSENKRKKRKNKKKKVGSESLSDPTARRGMARSRMRIEVAESGKEERGGSIHENIIRLADLQQPEMREGAAPLPTCCSEASAPRSMCWWV